MSQLGGAFAWQLDRIVQAPVEPLSWFAREGGTGRDISREMAIGESINVDDLRVIDACLCCTCMLYTKPGCIGCSGKSQCCCVVNETCCKIDKICNDCVPGLGISAFGIGCPCCLGCCESPAARQCLCSDAVSERASERVSE